MRNHIHLLGYGFGLAASLQGCAEGPLYLKKSGLLSSQHLKGIIIDWDALFPFPTNEFHLDKYAATASICTQLASYTQSLASQQKFFITLGGDHTSAIGTWSGVFAALPPSTSLGLLWVDAHMDSHTDQSSPSGNIHGMPLACLLGYGHPQLTQLAVSSPKLKPEHVALVGIRSYEDAEAALLKKLGVRVYFMDEIEQRGLKTVMQEALAIVSKATHGYGLSIDIDGFEPADAPGTGIREAHGIKSAEFCTLLKPLFANDPKLIGMEIVEFNPHEDLNNKTALLIQQIIREICA